MISMDEQPERENQEERPPASDVAAPGGNGGQARPDETDQSAVPADWPIGELALTADEAAEVDSLLPADEAGEADQVPPTDDQPAREGAGSDVADEVGETDETPSVASPPQDGTAADAETRATIPELLPVLPIRDTVVFPGTIVPLTIGREKSKRLLNDIITGAKVLGVVSQRKAETEDPSLDDLYRVGTVVSVLKLLNLAKGHQSIIVHGVMRFGIEAFVQTEPYLVARAHPREDTFEETTELEALITTAKNQAERAIAMMPNVPEEAVQVLHSIEKPTALADFLAANLAIDLVKKQELLETFDVPERLRKINRFLAHQIEVLELSRKIQDQVKGEIEKSQREYYLHEQLEAIRKELGETDTREAEIEDLRKAVAEAKMPEAVQKEADRELDRLRRIPQASPEYSGIQDYLHWLCEVPWSISTEDNLDIARAEGVLNADHHGLEKVKKRILEFLAVRKLNPKGRSPILCFAGPPGVGKTSLGQSIARAMGRKFIRMSVGGVRDEADIRGHRRTYIGALPGRIMQEIRKAGANNPVFMIDEVDKIGADFRGDPSSALLEVLDPEQNSTFQDHYLGVPFDLSRVMFICTANYMEAVPPPLRDRVEVMDLPGYTRMEKLEIARKYLLPRQLQQTGLSAERLRFTDQTLETIIDAYTAEAGVRNLEREIGGICRGVAAQVARGGDHPSAIKKSDLAAYLGPIKHEPELALRTSVPGVVTGLAWTPVGGDILFVEATSMPGKGNLMLTGHLGDVMRESAHAALSIVRSHARKYKLDAKALAHSDIHIHVPAGAIPKDGPSAGVAMFTALVSLLTRRPCRPDVAMTGEITLRGQVLPIGGLKEKTLGAHRAGIRTIIIPHRNKKDLVDVPPEILKQIQFVPVKTVDDVLKAALAPKGKQRAARVGKAHTAMRTRPPGAAKTPPPNEVHSRQKTVRAKPPATAGRPVPERKRKAVSLRRVASLVKSPSAGKTPSARKTASAGRRRGTKKPSSTLAGASRTRVVRRVSTSFVGSNGKGRQAARSK